MKKTLLPICFLLLACLLGSCRKFLEESSPDLIRPVTVEHYKELLQGEGYFKDIYRNGWWVDVMSDNIAAIDLAYPTTAINTKARFARTAYQWAQDLEEATGTFTDRLFQAVYKGILTANTCLEAVEDAEGTEAEKSVLRGQAYFTRAYGYFVLANLYAQAYNEASPGDLCVPLIRNTVPTLDRFNRATMKEIWDLMSEDITAAVANLEKDAVSRTYYEISYSAALVLASRIFLFREEYDKVISYGEKFLVLRPALKNISAITSSPSTGGTGADRSFLYAPENPEIVLTFGRISSASSEGTYVYFTREATGLAEIVFSASADVPSALINSYGANDRRKNHWFTPPSGTPGAILSYRAYTPMKLNYYDGVRTSQNLRTAEVYLNLAEAYAKKESPDNGRALQLLNHLRRHRIGSYTDLTSAQFPTQQALQTFVLEERRRELCFEEFHRWWDLRRTGQPAFEHQWLTETYELKEKDPAYVLNFPLEELEFNPELTPNPRPVRNPK